MSDIGSSAYSATDASNNQPPPAGWPSGMFPNQVEGAAQANMGATKRWYNRANPIYTTAGTNTAYTVTSVGTAESAYYTGQLYFFIVNATCGANPTLNWDNLGPVNLRKFTSGAWANLATGDLQANQIVGARYNGAQFDVVLSSFNYADFVALAANNTFTGNNTFNAALAFAAAAVIGTRSALKLDQRTTVADAAYTVTTTDYLVVYTSITAARTVTLPVASTINAGRKLVIMDGSGSVSQTNSISIAPNGTDTIAGSNTTQVAINIPRGTCVLVCNGANGWDVEQWSVRYVNTLGADVPLGTVGTAGDGPSCAQGTVGTWRAYGKVTINGNNSGAYFYGQLWDGTTNIDSAPGMWETSSTPTVGPVIPFQGIISAPVGNIKISVTPQNNTTAKIAANMTGFGKDSTLTVERIA